MSNSLNKCENDTATISCSNNGTISGGNINYGRWDAAGAGNAKCAGPVNTTTVKKGYGLPSKCLNQSSCTFVKSDFTGDDPAPGTAKQYDVYWDCSNSATPAPNTISYTFYFDALFSNKNTLDATGPTSTDAQIGSITCGKTMMSGIQTLSCNYSRDYVCHSQAWNCSNWVQNNGSRIPSGQNYVSSSQNRFVTYNTNANQKDCINWGGNLPNWKCSDNYKNCEDRGWQGINAKYNWTCYAPKQANYWFEGNGLKASAQPTVVTYLMGNPPFTTDPNGMNNTGTYPAGAVFQVTYMIPMPSSTITAQNIIDLLTTINTNSISTVSQNQNQPVAQKLIKDFCNYNGATAMSSDLCSATCAFQTFFNNNNATQPIKMCCDINTCQQGMISYCSQTANFTSPTCTSFYAQSVDPSTKLINPTVQGSLKTNCAQVATTGTNPTDVNNPLDPNIQNVCGCYLPESVYNNFKNTVTKSNPDLAASMTQKQCYYPMCYNSPAALYPSHDQCPDMTFISCISNSTTNLNAGGNISDVQVQNAQVQSCAANKNTPSSTPAATVAVASGGTNIPATPTPYPGVPSPTVAVPSSSLAPTVAGGYTPTPTTATKAGGYTPTPTATTKPSSTTTPTTAGPYTPSPSSSKSSGFCIIL
jgi:hypothetical protein